MSRVRISSSALLLLVQTHRPGFRFRAIGAAVARFPDTEEVTGSIPVSPTLFKQLSGAAFFVSPDAPSGPDAKTGQ
jgi:hypothetical protein